MKQVLQWLDSGKVELRDVPVPEIGSHQILVQSRASLVSAGTERMLVEFGRAGLLGKIRSQPDRVRQVVDKIRTDGLWPTLDAVRSKLGEPIPLGYCNAGVVRRVGAAVSGFQVGDRVVTNGGHAEWVRVAHTLAAKIPAGVADEAACFAPLGAVALQGIRLAAPALGETVVVFGLGLVGLLTVQLLRANGCRVIGIDLSEARRDLARAMGATTLGGDGHSQVAGVLEATEGLGADAVLLTLSSKSPEPINLAAAMARPKGRLVLVGVTGLELDREPFFRKELTFAVSCSYGPGRYEPDYEAGQDISPAHVRWTAQRNFAAVLDQMAAGTCTPASLITHRIALADVGQAYDLITGDPTSLGVILEYPAGEARAEPTVSRPVRAARPGGGAVAGVIGAGNYARRTLLPLLQTAGFPVKTVVSTGGVDAALAGDLVDAELVGSQVGTILDDPAIDVVFILTRHDSHAALAQRALAAGKHVFVEKPLALREEDLDPLADAAARGPGLLTVGFNRRYASFTVALERHLADRAGPLSLICTINAGALPARHWTKEAAHGGGRIVGEACHFVDLARRLAGAPIVDLSVAGARDRSGRPVDDVAHLSVRFADGSIATIAYFSNGARAFPKETIHCSVDGKSFQIDNWRTMKAFGPTLGRIGLPTRADKGHAAELQAWRDAIRRGAPPIPYDELFDVSRWAIRAEAAVRGSAG